MATSTGFINPFTGFQTAPQETPWARRQRMDQEREVAMATLASALERAKMVKDASLAQTKAYEKVGTEQARLQDQDRRNKETAAQRDERKKRQQQSEARKMAAKLQADVDAATDAFSKEMTEPWFGKPKPKHSKEDIAAFRADYAARLAKANRAILNRMQDVKVNEDDGTFEFTGDNDLADMGDAEVAKEQGALPQKPGMNPGENPGNNPSPGAGANAGGGTPQFGITGPIGDPNTKYYMIGDSGEVIYIPRSAYFKGIGKPDPQNAPDASGGRRPSGLGSFEADMGDVESPAPAANPSPSPGVGPAATGGAPQDFGSAVVGAVRGMVSDLQKDLPAVLSGMGQAWQGMGAGMSPGVIAPVLQALPGVFANTGAASAPGQAWQGMGGGMPSGGFYTDVVAPVVGALREMYSKFRNDPTPEEIARVRELVATPEGRAQLEAGFGALSPRDQDRLKKAVSMSGVK